MSADSQTETPNLRDNTDSACAFPTRDLHFRDPSSRYCQVQVARLRVENLRSSPQQSRSPQGVCDYCARMNAMNRISCHVSVAFASLRTSICTARVLPATTRCCSTAGSLTSRSGGVDPLPDRPPEDGIANCTFYFTALAGYTKATGDAKPLEDRAQRLQNPKNWVVLVVTLALRGTTNPAVTSLVESRLLADGGKGLASLDAHHLASLAHAFRTLQTGAPELWAAVASRAAQLGKFGEADYANLESALSSAGLSVPAGVTREADV